MRRIGLFLFIIIVCAACNLSASPATPEPTYTPRPEVSPVSQATLTSIQPTFLPLAPPPATNIPVTSVPALGTSCAVYTTYSGPEPLNRLSLRSNPSATALQVLRVPNNAPVLLVPGLQEVAAEDYHWLNVLYVDTTQTRYIGWMARDSYSVNGVRDPSIATLRQAGTQAPC